MHVGFFTSSSAFPTNCSDYDRTVALLWSGMKPTDRNPVTETKISILDSKTNTFLTLFILGLYYEVHVLNEYYPRGRKRLDLKLFFKLRFIVSRGMKPTDQTFSVFFFCFFFLFFFFVFFFSFFSVIFDKQSISLLHRSLK